MLLKFLGLVRKMTEPEEARDEAPLIACEAPSCKKIISSPMLECGVCRKKIHAACDVKTMNIKKSSLKFIFYCSYH